jgi:hypothetical protein
VPENNIVIFDGLTWRRVVPQLGDEYFFVDVRVFYDGASWFRIRGNWSLMYQSNTAIAAGDTQTGYLGTNNASVGVPLPAGMQVWVTGAAVTAREGDTQDGYIVRQVIVDENDGTATVLQTITDGTTGVRDFLHGHVQQSMANPIAKIETTGTCPLSRGLRIGWANDALSPNQILGQRQSSAWGYIMDPVL